MPKKFIDRYTSDMDFYKRVEKLSNNTMQFENLNTAEKYKNDEIKKVSDSLTNLFYTRNPVFDKLLLRILSRSNKVEVPELKKEDWDLNPYLASYDLYGTAEYWWILLLGNRMSSIYEFTKLPDFIYKPDILDLKEQIRIELKKNENVGEIV